MWLVVLCMMAWIIGLIAVGACLIGYKSGFRAGSVGGIMYTLATIGERCPDANVSNEVIKDLVERSKK